MMNERQNYSEAKLMNVESIGVTIAGGFLGGITEVKTTVGV